MNLVRAIGRTVCAIGGSRHLSIACLEAMIIVSATVAAPWKPIPVYPSANDQEAPDIYGNQVVWQELISYQGGADWDIYSADIADPKTPVLTIVSEFTQDQMYPAIFETTVAWQDNYYGDWDIYIHDISSTANQDILLTDLLEDQSNPAISGNFVVWQDNTSADWDIYLGDITDTTNVRTYNLTPYTYDQQNPAIDREWVTWEDNYVSVDNPQGIWDLYGADVLRPNKPIEYLFGGFIDPQQRSAISGRYVVWQQQYNGVDDWDIFAEDISDPANPRLITIANDFFNAINPDISGNLIVWQDDRNGDWDIYGYNLATRREFLISDDQPNQTVFSNQTNPAIDGTTVVWEDDLGGTMNIYMAVMSGFDEVATCTNPPLGDANGDCVVNLTDLADFSQSWLSCGLDPIAACP